MTTAEKEGMERQANQAELRDRKLRLLQEAFEEIIPEIIQDPETQDGIPEIHGDGTDEVKKKGGVKDSETFRSLVGIFLFSAFAIVSFFWFTRTIRTQGELVPRNRVVIKSPFDGKLGKIFVNEGGIVKEGDLIGEMDCSDVTNEMKKRKEESEILAGEVMILKATMAQEEASFVRKKRLFDQGVVTIFELEKAEAKLSSSRIDFQKAVREQKDLEAKIISLEDKQNIAKLVAPLTGTVVTHGLYQKRNAFLEKGDKICEVADINDLIVEASIPEEKTTKVKIGGEVRLKFPLSSKWYTGRIIKISDFSGRSKKTLDEILQEAETKKGVVINVALEEKPSALKYGMAVKVRIKV